jgi:hypothetical protein
VAAPEVPVNAGGAELVAFGQGSDGNAPGKPQIDRCGFPVTADGALIWHSQKADSVADLILD